MSKKRQLTPEEIVMASRLKAAIASIPGMTEERLGADIGVSQGAVSHWTGARLRVPAVRARAVAAALGIADPAEISAAYREVTRSKVAEEAPVYRTHATLDPTKIAETVTALRIVFARRGAVYDITSPADAEIFTAAYAIRELMPEDVDQDDLVEEVAKVVPIRGNEVGRSENSKAGRAHRSAANRERAGTKA
jgi:DNA-binding transcriptional regulator YdaS (Cro superfamily)